MVLTNKQAWAATVAFLEQHGLDRCGQPVTRDAKEAAERRAQQAFEKRQVRTPTGGINGRHR